MSLLTSLYHCIPLDKLVRSGCDAKNKRRQAASNTAYWAACDFDCEGHVELHGHQYFLHTPRCCQQKLSHTVHETQGEHKNHHEKQQGCPEQHHERTSHDVGTRPSRTL
eukprot:6464280-Amphidinium_carterae.1